MPLFVNIMVSIFRALGGHKSRRFKTSLVFTHLWHDRFAVRIGHVAEWHLCALVLVELDVRVVQVRHGLQCICIGHMGQSELGVPHNE